MTKEQEILLYLVRIGIGHDSNSESYKNISTIDWKTLIELSYQQNVAALAVGGLQRISESFPEVILDLDKAEYEDIKYEWFGSLFDTEIENARLNKDLLSVYQGLESIGIKPVLLKGQGIASYYPKPELRQSGDIDIYVGEKSYPSAKQFVFSLADSDAISSHREIAKELNIRIGGSTVEIHRYCAIIIENKVNRAFQQYAIQGLTKNLCQVNINGQLIDTPEDNFNAFYIFYHLWHHFMKEGVCLRQICDWSIFLYTKAQTLDVQYLRNLLNVTKCQRAWQTFGCFVVQNLGLEQEYMPFYDISYTKRAAMLAELIMSEKSIESNRPQNYWLGKIYSLKKHLKQIIEVFMVFPQESIYNLWAIIVRGFRQIEMDKAKYPR